LEVDLAGHLGACENPPVFAQAPGVIDPSILQRIVARDATAVAELYDQFGSVLYGVILRILRRRSDADEVLQDVFIRVWTRAEMYDETYGMPAAWLIRLARNRAIDCLRARRARGDLDAPGAQPPDGHHPDAAASTPESLAEAAEQQGVVRDALGTLPIEQRSLIEAAFFEGYTHRELAERYGLPLGTVKTRIRTGMTTMRDLLERV
jgi:RNA polymerase sigma-70 factor (ECF subfamily)